MLPLTPLDSIEPPQPPRVERRTGHRFQLTLDLCYRLMVRQSPPTLGFGKTIDVSSRGVLFESENLLPSRGDIEISLKWPMLLNSTCNLQLIIKGRIVRLNERKVAVYSETREFRTAARSTFDRAVLVPIGSGR